MSVYSFRQYAIRCDIDSCTATSWDANSAQEAIDEATDDGWIRVDGKWECAAHHPETPAAKAQRIRDEATFAALFPDRRSLPEPPPTIWADPAYYRTGPYGE